MTTLTLLAALCASSAHARRPDAPPAPPEPPIAITPEDVVRTTTPGSLFDDFEARRLMGMDGSARRVGDLVTVRVFEESRTLLAAATSTSKRSDHQASLRALFGIEKRILKAH